MAQEPIATTRGGLALAGLLLLAALSYGLLRLVESSLREPELAESQAPLLTVERFQAMRLNEAGRRESVVAAPRLTQWPGQIGTRIEQPVLDWYQADGQTRGWRLRAEQGWIAADRQTMRLESVVVMTRAADSGKPPIEVTTRDMLIRPTERTAETAAPIRAVTPSGELRAVGARVWLDREQLELRSAVRGYYEPFKR